MRIMLKNKFIFLSIIFSFFVNIVIAEEEEIFLKAISDQIQVITKDLKTLEKAVYQKSDVISLKPTSSSNSDGLNEDIMTKHLLKLNEIEDQFRELTNKFEEVNFKLDKLSTRVTKIQSDTQMRFTDLENGDSRGDGGISWANGGLSAVAGYPHITIPLDFVNDLPVGVSFLGTAWDEANLINAAYSFEQENKFFPIPK